MERFSDSLKELSARLVQMLRSKDQHQVMPLMSVSERPLSKPSSHGNIGIWEPSNEDGAVAFLRPDNSDPWRMWADVDRIEPKGSKSRAVLIGESVARGFLLDPYFNCAIALETMLKATAGDSIEIVDLARSGLAFNDLREVLLQSLALQPDVYVIFAGNNWHIPYTEILLDFGALTGILQKTDSWAPVSRHIGELVQQQVRSFIKWLGRFSAEQRIPIIFVIPESNLMDWEPNYDWQSPRATDDLIRRRSRLKKEAEEALAQGDIDRAASLATELLIEPDEELSPIGFEILAKCKLIRGELGQARRLKEKAWDVPLTLPVDRPPRCYSLIQEVLRHEGPLQGLTIVDLPKQFEERFPEILPNRRFFLDHCHLSVEGIRFAMACVAQKLLELLGKPAPPWPDLNSVRFELDRRGVAQAHVGAAFEHAIHGQKSEMIRYHLLEAIRQEPEIADLLHVMLDWHIRPYYHIKYVAQLEGLLSKEGVYCLKFPMQTLVFHPGNKGLYPDLVECLTDILSEAQPAIRTAVDLLLKQELGVTPDGRDLLNRSNLDLKSAQLEQGGLMGGGEIVRLYFKSFGVESRFRLICATPCDVSISLTCRVPSPDAAKKPVSLVINDAVAQTFLVAPTWQTCNAVIPSHLLREGINSIVIQWPELNQPKQERVKELAKTLESVGIWGNYKDIYSVYGEVHEFKASMRTSISASDRNYEDA